MNGKNRTYRKIFLMNFMDTDVNPELKRYPLDLLSALAHKSVPFDYERYSPQITERRLVNPIEKVRGTDKRHGWTKRA